MKDGSSGSLRLLGLWLICILAPEVQAHQARGYKKKHSCSTQLRLKFIVLINVKMATIIVGILHLSAG